MTYSPIYRQPKPTALQLEAAQMRADFENLCDRCQNLTPMFYKGACVVAVCLVVAMVAAKFV